MLPPLHPGASRGPITRTSSARRSLPACPDQFEADSVRSVERGRLERGDEVEILDSYEGYLEIRTPDGITGWILRHTIISA
jgi:SH3-like domain-containing protein